MAVVNFTGLASGIDSNGIIEAILAQQRASRIKPLEAKIEATTATNESFTKLKELLGTLNTKVQKFREINGTALSKIASSSSDSRVTASAQNGAANGSYAVTVTSLAKNASFSFNDRFSSSSTAVNASINNGASAASRTVSVDVGTGADLENVDIEITNTTSISDFVTQFNAASTKAEATVVNVGTSSAPSYAVVINSINQGTEKGQVSVSVGSEITSAGSGALSATSLSQATNAVFSIAGVSGSFTRSTNTVTDVLNGVSLELVSTGSATVSIKDDPAATKTSIQDFVDSYNEIVSYIDQNDLVSRSDSGDETIFGSLAGTSLDENILSSLRGAFSQTTGSGGAVNTLSDLGITTQRDGTLKFDTAIFDSAIVSDYSGVGRLTSSLGERLGAVDGLIAQYTQFQGLLDRSVFSNQTEIETINERVASIEDGLKRQEESLKGQFARLESLVGKLNSTQSALSGILKGI